jgi:two-component system, LytTR family, sensor kinase
VRRPLLLLWCAWTAGALLLGLQILAVDLLVFGGKIEWWRPVAIQLLVYQVWWALTPAVLALGRRYRLDGPRWRRSLGVHALASLVVPTLYLSLCHVLVLQWLRPPAHQPPTFTAAFFLTIGVNIQFEVATYWILVGIQHAVRAFREGERREVQAAQLEARLMEARLHALKMQIQPHFLFNALNAVSALIHEDPEAADHMLARLGDLLRLNLEDGGRQEVPLREELDFLERYLDIERIRFADRLSVRVDAAPETLDALVPNLVLQPLVENAIRHGIARRPEPGVLAIRATRGPDGRLRLRVRNDGPPLPEPRADGIGLRNTRARLEQMYGPDQVMTLESDADGVRVDVVIPFRAGAPEASGG